VSDLAWTGLWGGVLAAAIAACVLLRAAGVAATYVRDLLHVGAALWVVGWPAWHAAGPPVAIAAVVTAGIAVVPVVARRWSFAGRFARSVSDGDETWTGLVLYGVSFTALTAVGVAGAAFPAAAALLALSLGDGIGGGVGRRFGVHRYRVPWGKAKSLEGSAAVAAAAAVGVVIAGHLFDHAVTFPAALGIGLVAAVAEGIAPRSTDNAIVPAAAFVAAGVTL
jgi:dolichol kinase